METYRVRTISKPAMEKLPREPRSRYWSCGWSGRMSGEGVRLDGDPDCVVSTVVGNVWVVGFWLIYETADVCQGNNVYHYPRSFYLSPTLK